MMVPTGNFDFSLEAWDKLFQDLTNENEHSLVRFFEALLGQQAENEGRLRRDLEAALAENAKLKKRLNSYVLFGTEL